MVVGSARLELRMPENFSLKDKRRILKSLRDRMRRRFNVAFAEVDRQQARDYAVVGLACVSGTQGHVRDMLNRMVAWLERELDGEVVRVDLNVW